MSHHNPAANGWPLPYSTLNGMPVSQQYANSQGPTDIRGEGEAGDSIMPRAQAYQQANGTTLAQDAGGRGSNNIAVECPHCHRDFDSEKNLSCHLRQPRSACGKADRVGREMWCCPRCNKQMVQKASVKRHIRTTCWKTCDACCAHKFLNCDSQTLGGDCTACARNGVVCVSHTQAIPNQVPQLGTYTAGDEEDEQEEEDDSAQSVLSVQSEARTVRHKQESEACQRALRHVRAMIDARGSYPAAQFPDDSQVWQQQQQYQRLHLQQQNIQQHQQQLRLQQQRLEQQFGPQQHPQQHHHQQQHSQQHHYQQQQQCHPQQQYYEDNDDDPEIVDDLEGYETESNEDEIQNANNVFQIYQYNEIVRLKQEVVDLRAKLVQRDLKIIELQMESDGLRMNLASRRAPG